MIPWKNCGLAVPAGPVLLDEAVDAARVVCETNPSAALVCLMPMHHSGVMGTTVTKNRRSLEDMLTKQLGSEPLCRVCASAVPIFHVLLLRVKEYGVS